MKVPAMSEQRQEFIELVGEALKLIDDRLALDEFPTLHRLPAVQQWLAEHPREWLARGKAVQMHLRQAVEIVIAEYAESPLPSFRRIADFARGRYLEGKKVAAVARALGVSRSLLVHETAPTTLRLIATALYWLTVTSVNPQQPLKPVLAKGGELHASEKSASAASGAGS
jgi:hypothetical protein